MNNKSDVLGRLALFGTVAGLLIWLGTLRPKVASVGPGVVMVKQGSNTTFEPQNQANLWHVRVASHLNNAEASRTNATSK